MMYWVERALIYYWHSPGVYYSLLAGKGHCGRELVPTLQSYVVLPR